MADRDRMLLNTESDESKIQDWIHGSGTWVIAAIMGLFVLFFIWGVIIKPIIDWIF